MSKNYDAIIIGAGSVGIPTTLFLAEKGLKVLCIDKHSSPGQGQNKAAIGGVRATHSDPGKIKVCQETINIFSNWKEKYGNTIGWKKGGYCYPVYTEKEKKLLKSILPKQKKYDLNINWVNDDIIKQIIPGINPNGLIGGTYSPDDGQVCPLKTSMAMEKRARSLGAKFLYRTQVNDLILKRNKIESIKTEREILNCGIAVNAAGAFAREVAKMARIDIPVFPDSHEAGVSAPVEDFLAPLVVDIRTGKDKKTSNFYFGQNEEKAIIFCYTPLPVKPGTDRRSTSEFMPIIARRLIDLIPRLRKLRIRRLWRGLYPMTPDGVAIAGKAAELDNFYLAAGMCGQGLMMGPGIGKNLASLIVNGTPEISPNIFEDFSPSRNFYANQSETLK